jgi:CheY-like chemotaxis protein
MKTIALVEDNPDNRLLVQAMLEDEYEVIDYENGLKALEGLKGYVPDLILLDISLPEMDGAEVLREIRKTPELTRVPVIALTAHAMAGDRERFLGMGFNDYLTKPIIDEKILLASIESWLAPKEAAEGSNPAR